MQLSPKKNRFSEEKPRKTMKIIDFGAKPQVWRHWINHFESPKKVTQPIEQVNMM